MDKNTTTGFLLIFLLILGYQYFMSPSEADIAHQEQMLDSMRVAEQIRIDSLKQLEAVPTVAVDSVQQSLRDSLQKFQLAGQLGQFSSAGQGKEQFEVLENEDMRVLFSSKGGRIKEVELKKYFKVKFDSNHQEIKLPLKLLEDEKNHFEYFLPVATAARGSISSEDLFFKVTKNGNKISFRADAGSGQYFEQIYTIALDGYGIDYQVKFAGLDRIFSRDAQAVKLKWVNYLDKLEQNVQYERNYSTVYYKERAEDPDYCSCTSDDKEELEGKKVEWVAHSNQFFQSVLMAKESVFQGAELETQVLEMEESESNLKKLTSEMWIPTDEGETFAMHWYIGPKKFETLKAYELGVEDTVPFGYSIFGTVNRWIIRPVFNFLMGFIGTHGIAILLLTFLVKLVLYPLTYKMIHSQSKMAALKPQLASLKEKFKDDQQKQQMESMKIYQEFGVNPLGGCLPMVVQMPIWFALYRFFPASIEFRQADFLWATDLSSYDAAFYLPFEVPFYGEHVSLFTLLWAGTTVLYTYYNMKHLDMSSMNNPMMKYMQYGMPVMFLFFFNNFAAGLTCYLFFSNVFNIAQTVITKGYIIDHDKIKAELEAYRKKPKKKKKGGFQARLQSALAEQQRLQKEQEEKAKRNKKRK